MEKAKSNNDGNFWQNLQQCVNVIVLGTLKARTVNEDCSTTNTSLICFYNYKFLTRARRHFATGSLLSEQRHGPTVSLFKTFGYTPNKWSTVAIHSKGNITLNILLLIQTLKTRVGKKNTDNKYQQQRVHISIVDPEVCVTTKTPIVKNLNQHLLNLEMVMTVRLNLF